MARHDKIVNSSPAKNAQNAPLRNVYSGRDAPSRLGPRRGDTTPRLAARATARHAALSMSPMKPAQSGGGSGGVGASLGSARGVGAAEAQSWMGEKGCWGERVW
jgi:hypothetical protein